MAAKTKKRISPAIIAKARKVLAFAQKRASEGANRIELSNALFGPDGMASTTFTTEAVRGAFLKTKENDRIIEILVSLPNPPPTGEVIKIRIPPAANGKNGKKAKR